MRNVVLSALLVAATAGPAAAQVSDPRVFASVNATVRPAPEGLSDSFTFEAELETATVDVDYAFRQATMVDGGVTVRLWKRLGIGVAASNYSRDASAAVEAQIPHPFFFEQPRAIAGDATDLSRTETAVHVQLAYVLPIGGRWRVLLGAGPSRIQLEQEIVTVVHYEEAFPFDTATFRSTTSRAFKGSGIGFNATADVSFMFTRLLGIGGMARYSRATVDLDGPDNRRISQDAGGFQAGGGIRMVF